MCHFAWRGSVPVLSWTDPQAAGRIMRRTRAQLLRHSHWGPTTGIHAFTSGVPSLTFYPIFLPGLPSSGCPHPPARKPGVGHLLCLPPTPAFLSSETPSVTPCLPPFLRLQTLHCPTLGKMTVLHWLFLSLGWVHFHKTKFVYIPQPEGWATCWGLFLRGMQHATKG